MLFQKVLGKSRIVCFVEYLYPFYGHIPQLLVAKDAVPSHSFIQRCCWPEARVLLVDLRCRVFHPCLEAIGSISKSQLRGCTVALDTGIDTNKNNSFQAYVIVYLYYVKAHSVCDTFFGAIRLSVFLTNSRVLVHAPSLYRRLPVAIRLTDYLTAGSW